MIISTPEAMIRLWEELANRSSHVLLHGELWAGKTLLTKWFAKWLNIDENIVKSPTYTYINSYEEKLLHMDLYRLEEFKDMINKWLIDQMYNHEFIAIEWPKFIENLALNDPLSIFIKKIWENEREIIIK